MIADDLKNSTLEQTFKTYLDGVSLPEIDLSAAKAAVRKRSRSRRNGKIWAAAMAVAASVILLVTVVLQMLPRRVGDGVPADPAVGSAYSISETAEAAVSYTELYDSYRDALAPYEKFVLADNADARFTSYSLEGDVVLVRVEFAYLGRVQLKGTVYLDLTGGAKRAEELADFRGLADSRYGYRYETDYENAEYYSKAYWERRVPAYIDLVSNSADGLGYFLSLIS